MQTINETAFDPDCAAQHIAMWAVEPHWFTAAVESVKAGTLEAKHATEQQRPLYAISGDGIAVIPIAGAIMKGDSKFGGTSSLRTRRAVRTAVADGDVKAWVLHIDSPGGTVAGIEALANDIHAANRLKPGVTHIEDLGASAAIWAGFQTSHVTATPTSEVGSIGVVAFVEDSSKRAKMDGITVHVLHTGEFKGAGRPGTVVTPEQLEDMQTRVDDVNAHFLKAVARGRGMPISQVRTLADGRVHIASKALGLGLIDGIGTLEQAMKVAGRLADDGAKSRLSATQLRSRRAPL